MPNTTAARRRTTVSAAEYVRSHGAAPRGHGRWMFRNADTGEEQALFGLYSKVKGHLPGGAWNLLP